MKKRITINEELNKMKDLFNYKRGVVISEQKQIHRMYGLITEENQVFNCVLNAGPKQLWTDNGDTIVYKDSFTLSSDGKVTTTKNYYNYYAWKCEGNDSYKLFWTGSDGAVGYRLINKAVDDSGIFAMETQYTTFPKTFLLTKEYLKLGDDNVLNDSGGNLSLIDVKINGVTVTLQWDGEKFPNKQTVTGGNRADDNPIGTWYWDATQNKPIIDITQASQASQASKGVKGQIPDELKDVTGVQKFQTWLDGQYPDGWATSSKRPGVKYKVESKTNRGYGNFGDNTMRMWNDETIRKKYLESIGVSQKSNTPWTEEGENEEVGANKTAQNSGNTPWQEDQENEEVGDNKTAQNIGNTQSQKNQDGGEVDDNIT